MRYKAIIKAIINTILTLAVFGGALYITEMVRLYAPKWLQALFFAVCVVCCVYSIFKMFYNQYRK